MNYLSKDITTVTGPAVILQGVNCQRAMNSGVAKALYSKWPQVKETYMQQEMRLGNIAPVEVGENLYVVNCWTQKKYGYDNKIYASGDTIRACLQHVAALCEELGIANVFTPRIGCGLGGLHWEKDVLPHFSALAKEHPQLNINICNFNQGEKHAC